MHDVCPDYTFIFKWLRAFLSNFGTPTRQTLCKNNAQSDYVGVEKFNPNASEIVLRNGRTIKYENLVIAMGQK